MKIIITDQQMTQLRAILTRFETKLSANEIPVFVNILNLLKGTEDEKEAVDANTGTE